MSTHKAVRPNCESIGDGWRLVRTQAGFRKAFKEFKGADFRDFKPENWPREYPALVRFYYARFNLHCEVMSKQLLQKLLECAPEVLGTTRPAVTKPRKKPLPKPTPLEPDTRPLYQQLGLKSRSTILR